MGLPLNIEELIIEDVRKYRNRRIGEFLRELHLTEGRQTGIPTILKELEKNNSPEPVFATDNERSYFKTTFFINPEFEKLETSLEQVFPQVPPQYPASTQQKINDLKSKFEELLHHEGVIEGVKERLLMELFHIKEKGFLRRPEAEKIFKVSKATAERDIAFLKKLELIEFVGSPKAGRYVLTEKGKRFF